MRVVVAWLLPLSLAVVALSVYASYRAVAELGGVGPFFCGGRAVVRALLGRGAAGPPGRLVTWGPYSAARHPVYSATIAAYAALTLAVPGLALGLALATAWVAAAALAEERVALRLHPGYTEYARRVPMLAPLRVTAWAARELAARARRGLRP